ALEPGAPAGTLDAARDLARLLSLRGLERLLASLAPHAGGAWSPVLEPVVGQVRGAAAECGRAGDVVALRRLDDELALMAQVIERVPLVVAAASRGAAAGGPSRPASEAAPVLLGDVLTGLPVQSGSEALLEKVRLRAPVAGALRAALD